MALIQRESLVLLADLVVVVAVMDMVTETAPQVPALLGKDMQVALVGLKVVTIMAVVVVALVR
jgi:polyribonucleotide nucleotidyltransferase